MLGQTIQIAFCVGTIVVCILRDLNGIVVVSFIQLLAARRNHSLWSCNNIGVICGNDKKSILAWWPIHLMLPSQLLWLTTSRLGKSEWKESKKKISVVCSHCSSKLSSWDRKIRSWELKWLRSVARRAIAPFLSRPTLTRVAARQHAHPDDT